MPNNGRLWFAQDFSLDERLARECHCTELYTHVSRAVGYEIKRKFDLSNGI